MPLHLLRHAQLDLTVSNKDFGLKVTYRQLDPDQWPTNSHCISSLVGSAILCNSVSAKPLITSEKQPTKKSEDLPVYRHQPLYENPLY